MIPQRLAVVSKSHLRSLLSVQRQGVNLAATRPPTMLLVRSFAGAREKLQTVMEDYRKKNYGQELPSRFAKEVTKAADLDGDGFISVSEVGTLLSNIGAQDSLTEAEIEEVMEDIGNKEGPKGVPVADVIDYVKKSSKHGVS